MTFSCNEYREHMTAEARRVRPWSQEIEAHLQGCAGCEAWATRLELHVRALGELEPASAPAALGERVASGFEAETRGLRAAHAITNLTRESAPADLEGRVVAAMHGGAREERVIAELRTVGGPGAPAALDRRIEDLFVELRDQGHLPAPEVPEELEQRVDEDLQDLPGSISGRLLGKLERLEAPTELEPRVEAELKAVQPSGRRAWIPTLLPTGKQALAAGLAVAASLVLWAGLGDPFGGRSSDLDRGITRVENAEELSPQARKYLDQVSGGALSALQAAKREALSIDVGLGNRSSTSGGSQGTSQQPAAGQPAGAANGASAIGGHGNKPSVGGGANSSGSHQLNSSVVGTPFDLVASAPLTNSFLGTRTVLVPLEQGGFTTQLEYREDIATDGRGNFAIEPVELISPIISGEEYETFELLQRGRQGFFFRSRDFSVHNIALFWQNYEVVDLGVQADVAGVNVALFDISRLDGNGNLHRIGLDLNTSVVLFQEETTREGALVSRVTFESFAYDADLSNIELSGRPSMWVPCDAGDSSTLGLSMLRPTAPPTGFTFQGAATLAGFAPSGDTWAQLTYGDGVEQVFFAYSINSAHPAGLSGTPAVPPTAAGDTLRVMTMGPWTILEGHVAGIETIVVGKVDEALLQQMMQSALETQ